LFVGWQWRDLRIAREQTRKQREAEDANTAGQARVKTQQERHER
jgi:hypothetical protein